MTPFLINMFHYLSELKTMPQNSNKLLLAFSPTLF